MPPSSTAYEVGTVMQDPPSAEDVDSRAQTRASLDTSPPEPHLSTEFSRFYAKRSFEVLPNLGPDEHDVFLMYAGGVKRTVVQREANLLDAGEARKYPREVQQSM